MNTVYRVKVPGKTMIQVPAIFFIIIGVFGLLIGAFIWLAAEFIVYGTEWLSGWLSGWLVTLFTWLLPQALIDFIESTPYDLAVPGEIVGSAIDRVANPIVYRLQLIGIIQVIENAMLFCLGIIGLIYSEKPKRAILLIILSILCIALIITHSYIGFPSLFYLLLRFILMILFIIGAIRNLRFSGNAVPDNYYNPGQ